MIFRVVILSLVLQSTNLSSLTLTNHRSVQPHAHQSVQRRHWWANRSATTNEQRSKPPNKQAMPPLLSSCCHRSLPKLTHRYDLTHLWSFLIFFFWSILDFLFDQWVLGWWCLMMVGWWWWLGGLMVGVDWWLMVGENEYFIWINRSEEHTSELQSL